MESLESVSLLDAFQNSIKQMRMLLWDTHLYTAFVYCQKGCGRCMIQSEVIKM